MSVPKRLPDRLQSPPNPADVVVPTACQYCVVGCGYEAHLWNPDAGLNQPPALEQAHWVSPAMTGKVRYNGQERMAAVLPDPKCPMNKGNHSPRGGTQGRELIFNSAEETDATRERITTPYVRTRDGFKAVQVQEAIQILAELIKTATDWEAVEGKVRFKRPSGLGVKLYEYQFLENTFAATRLFFHLIGSPNVAYHDRPSVASNTQGFNDSGIDPHGYAYEDIWDSDVLFIAGNNPYESQSVFFMQYMAGKRLIVLDPRRTITADYAVKTNGLHLHPKVLGADTLVLNALARYIRDQRRVPNSEWPDRLPYDLIAQEQHLAQAQLEAKNVQPDRGPDGPRRAHYQLSAREYLDEFLTAQPDLSVAAEVSGIPLADLVKAAEILAGPVEQMPPPESRKVSLIFEKGLIWGYSYQNTAAMANLGLLLGSVLRPGAENDNKLGVTGRAGGHQKGWAEVRYKVTKGGKTWDAGYPFYNASDEFQANATTRIRTHHYFDGHLTGTRIAPRHSRALPQNATPDINLLWVIGSNAVGQVGNAAAKWAEVERRRGTVFPEAEADVNAIIAIFQERIRQGGLVVVQQDIYPNPTTNHADLILPAAGWGEDDFTRYTGERRLRLYGKFQDSPIHRFSDSEAELRCLPDWQIFKQVAQALLPEGMQGNGLPTGYTGDELTRNHFAWDSTAKIFRDLAQNSNLKGLLGALEEGYDDLNPGGHPQLRNRGTRGFVIPVYRDNAAPDGIGERLRTLVEKKWKLSDGTPYGPYAFIKADWQEIVTDFERNRARRDEGEFFICNGRVNELWNSMFTHIRNETIRQRYPDDLPGTMLEFHPADAALLGVVNGDIVEVSCQQIHLGAEAASFKGVVSVQTGGNTPFLPQGMVFAVFSYPAMTGRLNDFPYREFTAQAYVNNITTGYVDPINPIAAVKYARGKIRKTGERYPHDAAHHAYLGPSYKPRNRAFPATMISSEQERLNWKMRELIVQKGLTRAKAHGSTARQMSFLDPDSLIGQLVKDADLRARFAQFLQRMKWPKLGAEAGKFDRWEGAELRFAAKWLRSFSNPTPTPESGGEMPEPNPNRVTSFRLHIRPLFRQEDIDGMAGIIDLTSYAEVRANSTIILNRLRAIGGSVMPPAENDGPWPNEWIALFERWIHEGHLP